MRAELSKPWRAQHGVSMMELLVVVFIVMITAAIASPTILATVYNIRLLGTASDLAGLMQQARIMAAKDNASPTNPGIPNNAYFSIRYANVSGRPSAFIDLNNNGNWDASVTIDGASISEPLIVFPGTVVLAAGPPSGTGSQPPPYVLPGDSSAGAVNSNANILGFSPRGLPCNYDAPPTCTTPAASYFVYYLTDTRPGAPGWAAVAVSKAGRTRVVGWDGTSWH